MADEICACGHYLRHHLRNGCAVDSDESWRCPCEQSGSGPMNADGSWPSWVNPAAYADARRKRYPNG